MIEIQNVNFRYNGGTGCGKSTLTRLVNGLIPHFYDGEISGKFTVNGLDIAEAQLL